MRSVVNEIPSRQIAVASHRSHRPYSFCLQAGDANRDLRNWVDRISSIDNPEGLEVQVCSEVNFRNCRLYTTSASSLGDFDDYIASIRVR